MNIINYVLNVLFVVLLILALGYKDVNILLLTLIILFASCLTYGLKNAKENIVYILYLVCFFTFLIGKYLYQFFDNSQWWKPFDKEVVFFTIIILIISLMSLVSGVIIASRWKRTDSTTLYGYTDAKVTNIRLVSKVIFMLTLAPTFYVILKAVIYTQVYGYLDLYLSYQGSSILLERLSTVNKISFYMYLSTMPKKKEVIFPIIIFTVYNFITLFTGQRTEAVIVLLIIFFYLYFRNTYDEKNKLNGEIWLSKKTIILAIGSSPILLSFLTYWSYYRQGIVDANIKWSDLFLGFFDQQGFSVSVISHSLILQLPNTNISYTFGPIINFLRNNIITQFLFNIDVYSPQTVEMALYGNTLSETLSYLVMPNVYLSGGGIGNSYLAELYLDFGLNGIIIFNIIIGIILYNINHFSKNKPWVFTLYLLILEALFSMPRSSGLRFITNVFNISTIVTIITIYFLARIKWKKRTID